MGSLLSMKDHLLYLLRQVGVHLAEDKFVIVSAGVFVQNFIEAALHCNTSK
ncbi:hypothetical protein SAMN04487895_12233 [Paenibacillus sophorae]|uniref:Uncharacterized protein n=1 Tax=Paenibacillus sophorae TaxID=1333845 RepID=A0A1H8V9G0_9BACL|nr:hypothetical protein [Paenibacillus sophorae]QWU13232.1 hypothetical protein KP014_14520 [Paenibacillus sophorae]SEP12050.1 hypothetical protein SAMN04487895_12233 [Paenibacillus sophorae]